MAKETVVLPELPDVGKMIARAAVSFSRPAASEGLPDRELLVTNHKIELPKLAAYSRLCGFALGNNVPSTWLHVLTFGLQAQLMASPDFPIPLAGLVHVSNEIELRRPVPVDAELRLAVASENLQPHRKGATFDLVGRIWSEDQLVWVGRSNYLGSKAKLAGEPPQTEREVMPEGEPSQVWRLSGNLGRRYAEVSGDINPIHLHPLTARLFGFPKPIIHGMWTHARALAAFGGQLPETYSVRVQFTKPIMLPNKVQFVSQATDESNRFAVISRSGKPCLVGSLRTN